MNIHAKFQKDGGRNFISWAWILFLLLLLAIPYDTIAVDTNIALLAVREFILIPLLLFLLIGAILEGRIYIYRSLLVDAFLLTLLFSIILLSSYTAPRSNFFEVIVRFPRVVAVYLATVLLTSHKDYFYKSVKILVLVAVISSVIAFIQSTMGIFWFIGDPLSPRSILGSQLPFYRAAGPYSSYSSYGSLLLFSLPILLNEGLTNNRRLFSSTTTITAMLLLILMGLVVSQTRGAWLAASVVLGVNVWYLIDRRYRSSPILRASIIILPVVSILTFLSFNFWIVNEFIAIGRGSVSVRVAQIKGTLLIVQNNPIIGVGMGSFIELVSKSGINIYGTIPHNIFLEVIVTGGLLGLVVFLLFLLRIMQRVSIVLSKGRLDHFSAAIIIGSIGVLCQAQFARLNYRLLIWVIFGLITALYYITIGDD